MTELREVQESPLVQGSQESIVYTLTTSPWGSSPGALTVAAFDTTDGAYTDVSETVLVGTATVDGDVITLPALTNLTAGHVYRLEVKFTCSGNVFECWAEVLGER